MNIKKILTLLLIVSQFSGCASNQSQIAPGKLSSDVESEISLGKRINELIISRIPLCQNEEINRYVEDIGSNVAKHAKRQEISYHFLVLQDDRFYATSAPGGFIYITSGFLVFLKNEAELAYSLGHEIGELQYKDPRLSQAHAMLENALKTGAAIAPAFGSIGALAFLGIVGVYSMTGKDESKDQRIYEADTKALEMMSKAGYDPQGAMDVFFSIAHATPKELMYLYDYYQTRPVTSMRLTKLENGFKRLDLKNKNFNTNRFHYIQMIEPLKPATAV